MIDAIVRTLWRLSVSRRRLLEWVSADRSARVATDGHRRFRRMWMAPVTGVAAGVLVARGGAGAPAAGAADDRALDDLARASPVTGRPLAHARQRPAPPSSSRCARSRGAPGGTSRTC
jgi:hypothetical protein